MSIPVLVPTGNEFCRLVLGEEFITPKEIAKASNLQYSDEKIEFFDQNLPSTDAVRWCKENNFLIIAGPPTPLSLLEVSALPYPLGFRGGLPTEKEGAFIRNEKVLTRWHALRKPVCHPYGNVTETLSPVECVPTCVEVAWCITVYKAVRETILLSHEYARTVSTSSKGLIAQFGLYAAGGYAVITGDDHDVASNVMPAVRADLLLPWGKKA